jgi:uracil-DNA glycosylase
MIDIEEIKQKLIDKLKDSGWSSVLKGFILSLDFAQIIIDLEQEVNNGKRFTPQLKNIFTAFEECKWDDLKIICIGQDPFSQIGIACGVAFDCRNTDKEHPSLTYFNDAIQRTVYNSIIKDRKTNLSYLSEQGVLMINTALTTQIDKPLTHQKIWQGFINYLLDTISSNKDKMIFIFLGKISQEYEELVSDKHYKLMVSHPDLATYDKLEEWDCKDIFNRSNNILRDDGKEEIKW